MVGGNENKAKTTGVPSNEAFAKAREVRDESLLGERITATNSAAAGGRL